MQELMDKCVIPAEAGRTTAQALALRSRIVVECAAGTPNQAVGSRLECTPQTVSKWRNRFAQLRLDGLLDAPRPGAPRTLDDARIDAVIAMTLEQRPANATVDSIMDNYGTHKTPKVRVWFARHPRFHVHFTPTSASWLNQVIRQRQKILSAGHFSLDVDRRLPFLAGCRDFFGLATDGAIVDGARRRPRVQARETRRVAGAARSCRIKGRRGRTPGRRLVRARRFGERPLRRSAVS